MSTIDQGDNTFEGVALDGGGLDFGRAIPAVDISEPYIGEPSGFDPPDVMQRDFIEIDSVRNEAPLGLDDPRGEDVHQLDLNDCWLTAPMASVAEHRPDLIQRRVTELYDGTAAVRLSPDAGQPDRIVRVSVDLPLARASDGSAVHLHADASRVVWPALLEKAYATQEPDGYRALNRGGTITDTSIAFERLTGRPSRTVFLGPPGDSATDAAVLRELRDHPAVVTIASRDLGADPHSLRDTGVMPDHAYWVERVHNEKVSLRNPWGVCHPRPVTVDELRQITIGEVTVAGVRSRR